MLASVNELPDLPNLSQCARRPSTLSMDINKCLPLLQRRKERTSNLMQHIVVLQPQHHRYSMNLVLGIVGDGFNLISLRINTSVNDLGHPTRTMDDR
jgi:hypothetical protein